MRDVNSGWLIRYTHANVASFFFILVYAHIGRALYYGSYKSPRVLTYAVGVIILVLMMADFLWPNWIYVCLNTNTLDFYFYQISMTMTMLPFNKARTKAINRIGPHDKIILELIICGMLGDFWADSIKGSTLNSVRFNIEQSISNTAYIHYLTLLFYKLGYCPRPVPTLIEKSVFKPSNSKQSSLGLVPSCDINNSGHTNFDRDSFSSVSGNSNFNINALADDPKRLEKRFNYKLTLFTFSSFNWIYESFYKVENDKTVKIVPLFIGEYLTPRGLANFIMQTESPATMREEGGLIIKTKLSDLKDINIIINLLISKYNITANIFKFKDNPVISIVSRDLNTYGD